MTSFVEISKNEIWIIFKSAWEAWIQISIQLMSIRFDQTWQTNVSFSKFRNCSLSQFKPDILFCNKPNCWISSARIQVEMMKWFFPNKFFKSIFKRRATTFPRSASWGSKKQTSSWLLKIRHANFDLRAALDSSLSARRNTCFLKNLTTTLLLYGASCTWTCASGYTSIFFLLLFFMYYYTHLCLWLGTSFFLLCIFSAL